MTDKFIKARPPLAKGKCPNPDCNGKGRYMAKIPTRYGYILKWADCPHCKGRGKEVRDE